jgi:hypothetical protein
VSPQLHFTTSQGFSHHPNAIGRARLQQLLADADVRGRATGRDTSTIPMVMVAVFADQPANASRVVQAGASLLITQPAGSANDRAYLDRDAVRELRIALDSVLHKTGSETPPEMSPTRATPHRMWRPFCPLP